MTFKVVVVNWRVLSCQFFDQLNRRVVSMTLILGLCRCTIVGTKTRSDCVISFDHFYLINRLN